MLIERWRIWLGHALSVAAILVLLRSALLKLIADAETVQLVVEQYGYPDSVVWEIGLLEFTCVLVFAIPRTTVLGAVLLTGYFGGAVATHVRIGEPFWIPLAVATVAWLGLYLRDEAIRNLVRRLLQPRMMSEPLSTPPS